jgi:tetratricopeptide (TPR) repeat protein
LWFSGTSFQAAECLTKAGRDEEARKLLPSEDRPEQCVHFFSLHLSLAEHFVNQGDQKAAGERLKRAFAVVQKHGKPKRMEYFEQMVRLWLRIGDREQAMVVRTEAARFVRDWIERGNRNTLLAEDRARVAKCHALLGDDQAAREAFADAVRIAIEADQRVIKEIEEEAPEDPDERKEWLESSYYYRRHGNFIQTVGQIGAWQFSSGYPQAARETYAKAIERLEQLPTGTEDRKPSFPRLKLVRAQCKEGDIAAALQSLEGENDPYWKLLGYCECASKLADGNPSPWVTKLIVRAESLVRIEKRADHRGWMLEKLVELKAQAGDSEGAKKTLNEALAASKADGGKNFQAIARTLIRQGRLEEAYRTIREIPEPKMRLLPLAELARRAAKEEDARKKK